MNRITLHKQWVVKAPVEDVFGIITDFEKFPEYFPKVAESKGTLIDYTYQVAIRKKWLRLVAALLLRWYSMKYWEKAVIDRLKNSLRNNIKIYRGPTPDFWFLLQEIGRRGAFAGLGDHF